MAVRDIGDFFDIGYLQRGIGERFAKQRLGIGLNRALHLVEIAEIREYKIYAQPTQRNVEQVECAAVYRRRRYYAVARRREREHRQHGRALPRRRHHCADAAFERGELALGHGNRGIAETRIEIPVVL